MTITYQSTKQGYLNMWGEMSVAADKVAAADKIVERIVATKTRYVDIQARSKKVPWFLIAGLHYRESDMDFDTYLGNGQSLHRATTQVPRDRGPFPDFEAGAIDALTYDGMTTVTDWTWPRPLYQAEAFNGPGYEQRNVNDPYVWSWSNLYTRGKYTGDGEFDPTFVDQQCGVAVIFKRLALVDAEVAQAIGAGVIPPPPSPLPAPTDVLQAVAAALRAAADMLDKGKT